MLTLKYKLYDATHRSGKVHELVSNTEAISIGKGQDCQIRIDDAGLENLHSILVIVQKENGDFQASIINYGNPVCTKINGTVLVLNEKTVPLPQHPRTFITFGLGARFKILEISIKS